MDDNVCPNREAEPPSNEEAEPPGSFSGGLAGIPKKADKEFYYPPTPETPFSFPAARTSKSAEIKPIPGAASFKINPRTRAFRKRFFPEATDAVWNDWHWQLGNRIRDLNGLQRILKLSEAELAAFQSGSEPLPISITPYYASLLDEHQPLHALRRAVVPVISELKSSPVEADDPLGEDEQSPVPGLVHRYPDRVLFLVTDFCSTYCRYCTRSRVVGKKREYHFNGGQWEEALAYIEATPTIRDVLISGGDPLTLPEDRLEWLLQRLRRIPHVEMLRIGTKIPAVLPQRITPALTRMLKRYHPLWMSIHFTHPDELTPEVSQACGRLANAGIPLGSQTVLLSGINDNVDAMKRLMQGLVKIRVRPYYLYQCDPISGSSHFRTPVEKGVEIIQGLRGHTSGYAVPTFVIDAPGGGGKIPVCPDYVQGHQNDYLVLNNYEGKSFRYPDLGGSANAGPAL